MANTQAPFGFRPVGSLSGNGETRINNYTVSSASARVYEGDLVMISSGEVIKVTVAAQTSVLGVAMRDSGAITADVSDFPVCDDPNAIFACQGTSAATATSVGLMCPITVGTLTNVAGLSVASADVGSAQATTYSVTYPILILGLVERPNNESGNYAEILVKINSHLLNP